MTHHPRFWRAGIGTVDITPPIGAPMACFPEGPGKARRATSARDRLLARTLVLGNGDEVIAICTADICMIHERDVADVRRRVTEQIPRLADSRIIIAASHTHSGPENTYLFGSQPGDPAIEQLNAKLAESVVAAWRDRESVQLRMGRTQVAINHNRRVRQADGSFTMVYDRQEGVTTGPTDQELCVWHVERPDGTDKALLLHYTAHALGLGPANRAFSADWPGVARACIEAARPECQVLMVNGAAGNLHPSPSMRADDSAITTVGKTIGSAVLTLLPKLSTDTTLRLSLKTRTLTVANRVDPTQEVELELQLLTLGDWQIGVVPGELFVELQLAFKQRLAPTPATIIGYANGWPGYLPPRHAFDEGGYGVDLCTTDPTAFSRTACPPGTAERLLEVLLSFPEAAVDAPGLRP